MKFLGCSFSTVLGFSSGWIETNDTKMEVNSKSCIPMTLEGVNYWLWSRLAKVALGNGVWKGHIKEEPLKKLVQEDGLLTNLKDEDKWIQEDQMALEIIQGSLSVSIL